MTVRLTIKSGISTAEQPSISICVPVYNDEEYLRGCLDSLLSQDYPNADIVLVDDGSTDSSGLICDEYASAHRGVIVVDHQKNRGPLLARRRGFELAKGEYVMCVDSDDTLLPGAVSLVGRTIAQTGADVVQFRATRSMDWQGERAPLASDAKCIFTPVEEKASFLAKLCQSTDGSQNPMAFKAVRRSCVGADIDLSSFSGLTFAEDFLQTVIVYDQASTMAELGAEIYYYRPESGITRFYAPHMYADVCRALDFAEGYARKWEDEYGCDGLIAGLAACRLDSAAQLAEYLAAQHDKVGLERLKASDDFKRCLNIPDSKVFLALRRRMAISALVHSRYSLLKIPSIGKRLFRIGDTRHMGLDITQKVNPYE